MTNQELYDELQAKREAQDQKIHEQQRARDYTAFHETLGESLAYSLIAHYLEQHIDISIPELIQELEATADNTRSQIKHCGDTASRNHWKGLTAGYDDAIELCKQVGVVS